MLLSYLSTFRGGLFYSTKNITVRLSMWLNSGKLSTGRLGWDYLQFEANLSCIAASILKMPQIQSPFPPNKSPPTLSIGTKYHSQIGFYALQATVFVEDNPFQIHCISPIVFLLDSVLRFLTAYFGVPCVFQPVALWVGHHVSFEFDEYLLTTTSRGLCILSPFHPLSYIQGCRVWSQW